MDEAIRFTQYLRPDGRRTPVSIERPAEVAAKARAIIAAGYRLECECLGDRGDNVSFTITNNDADHACEVVPNGPGVPDAVDKLILGFKLGRQ